MTYGELLSAARELAKANPNWIDLSNAIFDQDHGLLPKENMSREDREAFVASDEYRQIRELIREARGRRGQAEAGMDRVVVGPEEAKVVNQVLDAQSPVGKRVRHTPRREN